MRIVPKKNISRILQDITPPGGEYKRTSEYASSPAFDTYTARYAFVEEKPRSRSRRGGRIAISMAVLLLCVMGTYGYLLYGFKNDAVDSFHIISAEVKGSKDALLAFDSGSAVNSLKNAHSEFQSVEKTGNKYGLVEIGNALGAVWAPFRTAISSLGEIDDLLLASISAGEHIDSLKKNGADLFFNNKGGAVLLLLKQLAADMGTLDAKSELLMNSAKALGMMSQLMDTNDYLSLKMKMYETEASLNSLIGLLDRPVDTHLLLLFENPSEMRATGGFIGSYAVLTIHNGGLQNLEVRDIYDPDGQLDLKAMPPKPLQVFTTKWGARDANWFFDYPTSARKIIYFLEHSKMYSEKGITFDGAIAVNANAVASLIGVVGNIEVPEYKLTLNEENFLLEIQKEVRSGEGRKVGEPKQILKDVAPLLLEKFKTVNGEQMSQMISRIEEQILYKNILAYFKDKPLQDAMVKYAVAGEMYHAAPGVNGDYLAVVNTNIAGGKTDIFMNQHIVLKSTIDPEGKAQNVLTITRTHNGTSRKESWYRDANQNYLRVYAPEMAKLVGLAGNTVKTVYAPINYQKAGYEMDSDVVSEETKGKGLGKTVFGTWFTTPLGATKKLEFTYEVARALIPAEGATYEFVFERQASVNGGLEYEVEAPLGFRWKESSSIVYRYANNNPEGRVKITLTLQKI